MTQTFKKKTTIKLRGLWRTPFAELVKVFEEVLVDDSEFAREHAPRVEVRCVRLERLVVPCANCNKKKKSGSESNISR